MRHMRLDGKTQRRITFFPVYANYGNGKIGSFPQFVFSLTLSLSLLYVETLKCVCVCVCVCVCDTTQCIQDTRIALPYATPRSRFQSCFESFLAVSWKSLFDIPVEQNYFWVWVSEWSISVSKDTVLLGGDWHSRKTCRMERISIGADNAVKHVWSN
ncbi:unnamed protein product [Periconia digitata]|uniref:Uncharacterized protein n=1 Tax=Periconia digitata TaxID=1303443 RepID=A0A9W4UMI9_9PLEO|nr:unnamed protein product [Periconia digitata]